MPRETKSGNVNHFGFEIDVGPDDRKTDYRMVLWVPGESKKIETGPFTSATPPEAPIKMEHELAIEVDILSQQNKRDPSILGGININNRAAKTGHGFIRYQVELQPPSFPSVVINDLAIYLRLEIDGKIKEHAGLNVEGKISDQVTNGSEVKILLDQTSISDLQLSQTPVTLHGAVKLETFPHSNTKGPTVDYEYPFEISFKIQRFYTHNLVAIDFGTAALAAGVLMPGQGRDVSLLPLRNHLKPGVEDGESGDFISSVLQLNPKVENPNKERLGEAGAVNLPMPLADMTMYPLGAVKSLKTLASYGTQRLSLPANAKYYDEDGNPRHDNSLTLWPLVRSAYAKLLSDYVQPALSSIPSGKEKFSKLVLTHPNTYTCEQINQLKKLAESILIDKLQPDHLHLISESDAVLFYFVDSRDSKPQSLEENVLVFDMGAGTLDMSLATISWNEEYEIKKITIHGKLGVPLAGDYLTEAMVRFVHNKLVLLSERNYVNIKYSNPLFEGNGGRGGRTIEWIGAAFTLREQLQALKPRLNINGAERLPIGKNKIFVELSENAPNDCGLSHVTKDDIPHIALHFQHSELLEDAGIQEAVQFITERLTRDFVYNCQERAKNRGTAVNKIHTVILSGRSSKWPGIKERIENVYKDAEIHQFAEGELKSAVVIGALRCFRFVNNPIIEDFGVGGDYSLEYHDKHDQRILRPVFDNSGTYSIKEISRGMFRLRQAEWKANGRVRLDTDRVQIVRTTESVLREPADRDKWGWKLSHPTFAWHSLRTLFPRASGSERVADYTASLNDGQLKVHLKTEAGRELLLSSEKSEVNVNLQWPNSMRL